MCTELFLQSYTKEIEKKSTVLQYLVNNAEWFHKIRQLVKRTEIAARLKTRAKSEPQKDFSFGTKCLDTPKWSEIRDRYVNACNHHQRYGVDATLIYDTENFYLEITYPYRPEPIRVKLEFLIDFGLMARFLTEADCYETE